MNIPCKFSSPCLDPSNPLANTSAELPDLDFFIGYNSFWAGDPPLGATWSSTGCVGQCTSTVSQVDADTCAANQQIICTTTDGGGDNGVNNGKGWINPDTGNHYDPRFNTQQTCRVLCPDGLPFSFTEPAGQILALNQGAADAAAFGAACLKAKQHRVCLGSLTSTEVCVGAKYSGSITATGLTVDALNNIWSAFGLPPGINQSFGIGGPTLTLSGTPTVAGSFSFSVTCLTPTGDSMTKTYTICVEDINQSTLPVAVTGVQYSTTLTAACDTSSLNWQVTGGALPPGLSLEQTSGIISGTTTKVGTFNFVVTVQTAAT